MVLVSQACIMRLLLPIHRVRRAAKLSIICAYARTTQDVRGFVVMGRNYDVSRNVEATECSDGPLSAGGPGILLSGSLLCRWRYWSVSPYQISFIAISGGHSSLKA